MQWKINCITNCRAPKSWLLGTGAARHQQDSAVGGEQAEQGWKGPAGKQNGKKPWDRTVCVRIRGPSKRQTHGKIQGVCRRTCPDCCWGEKKQRAKGESKTLPFPSTLFSLKAFKNFLAFSWYFLSHQSISCSFCSDGKSWWIGGGLGNAVVVWSN